MSNDRILMPRRLTAENGAKAALIGEFSVPSVQSCPSCQGCDSDDCPRCDGEGVIPASILVSWTTIKAIYAAAVEHFHPKPECRSIIVTDYPDKNDAGEIGVNGHTNGQVVSVSGDW